MVGTTIGEDQPADQGDSSGVQSIHRKYVELDAKGRRTYHALKQRERRARLKDALLLGTPRPTVPAIRDALADAAALLLREELSGADIVRAALVDAFNAPMLGSTVTGMARAGRLPPKRLSPLWNPLGTPGSAAEVK